MDSYLKNIYLNVACILNNSENYKEEDFKKFKESLKSLIHNI